MVNVSSFPVKSKPTWGVERLPSGKFDTNKLVLELTVFLRLRDSSASLEFHGFRDYLKQKD